MMDLTTEDSRRLQALSTLSFNYDADKVSLSQDKLGWKVDKYRVLIAQEAPGPVEADGPFARAKEAVQNYRFPDPDLITAVFSEAGDLSGRNMLLKAHFAGLVFYFGVRVVAVFDENKKDERGREVQTWGYAYRTLQGHFEIGEIRFLLLKRISTGEVYFEIDAYSKPDLIPNVFYRVGFKIFGRHLQKRFARTSIERIRKIATSPNVP